MPNINDAFPSKYLKASDLQGRSVVVMIDRVEFEAVGQTKEIKPVLYFVDKEKGMVLNKTNSAKIIGLVGSQQTEDWTGHQITIYPTETSFQGEQVDCIRVKPVAISRPVPVPPAARPVAAPPVSAPALTDDDIPF